MRHKVAFRSLSRPTGHRILMLRNLVSSLIEHDQITTTVAKAKETARLADKLITLCKRASLPSEIDSLPESGSSKRQPRGGKDRHYKNLANEFLLNQRVTHSKLFNELRQRYQNRQRGFTRIHLFGHRKGDHAPTAVLELVDSPKDLKTALTATRVGRELAERAIQSQDSESIQWRTASASSLPESLQGQPSFSNMSGVAFPMHKFNKRLQRDILKASHAFQTQAPQDDSQSLFDYLAKQSFDEVLGLNAFGPARPDANKVELQRLANQDTKRDGAGMMSPPKIGRVVKAGASPLPSPKHPSERRPTPSTLEDVMATEEGWVDEEEDRMHRKALSPMARANGVQSRVRRYPAGNRVKVAANRSSLQ